MLFSHQHLPALSTNSRRDAACTNMFIARATNQGANFKCKESGSQKSTIFMNLWLAPNVSQVVIHLVRKSISKLRKCSQHRRSHKTKKLALEGTLLIGNKGALSMTVLTRQTRPIISRHICSLDDCFFMVVSFSSIFYEMLRLGQRAQASQKPEGEGAFRTSSLLIVNCGSMAVDSLRRAGISFHVMIKNLGMLTRHKVSVSKKHWCQYFSGNTGRTHLGQTGIFCKYC